MTRSAETTMHARRHWAGGADPAATRWITVGDPDAPDYETPWTGTMRFRHDGNGDTEVEGDVTGGDYGDPIFYLPAAYWPTVTRPRIAGVTADDAAVVVTISAVDGAVTVDELASGGIQFGIENVGDYLYVETPDDTDVGQITLYASSALTLRVRPTGGTNKALIDMRSSDGAVEIETGGSHGVSIRLNSTGTLRVYNASGAQVFRVDQDGAMHGKTGKSLTFDL